MKQSEIIQTQPIAKTSFAAFGDVIDTQGDADKIINQERCKRYHDRAKLDFTDGRAGVSLFKAKPYVLPMKLDMMERHPFGSQTFIPMSMDGFLIIVAEDKSGKPGAPHAFHTMAGQVINIHRNIWHGVLTPLTEPGLFAVVDRIGTGSNLEEHWFNIPFIIKRMKENSPHQSRQHF